MSKLGKKLIEGLNEIRAIMAGEKSPEGLKVTHGCGCVFCDVGLKPIARGNYLVHGVKGEDRFVACTNAHS